MLSPSNTKRIYIAGPMTGVLDLNFPEFDRVTKELRADGFNVISPHEHTGPVMEGSDSDAYAWVLARDIMLLSECSTVILLDGWEDSTGANLEVAFAKATTKHIVTYETYKNDKMQLRLSE